MRNAAKLLSGFCVGLCGYCAIVDVMAGNYAIALVMVILLVLNLVSFTRR